MYSTSLVLGKFPENLSKQEVEKLHSEIQIFIDFNYNTELPQQWKESVIVSDCRMGDKLTRMAIE
jgi:hypothetical protein